MPIEERKTYDDNRRTNKKQRLWLRRIYSWNYFVIEDNTRVFVFNDYAVGYKDMVKKIYLYLKSKIKQQIVQETGYKTSIKKD